MEKFKYLCVKKKKKMFLLLGMKLTKMKNFINLSMVMVFNKVNEIDDNTRG